MLHMRSKTTWWLRKGSQDRFEEGVASDAGQEGELGEQFHQEIMWQMEILGHIMIKSQRLVCTEQWLWVGTVLNALHTLSHLLLMTIPQGRYFYSHSIYDKTGFQMVSSFVTVSGRNRVQTLVWFTAPRPQSLIFCSPAWMELVAHRVAHWGKR